MVCLSLSFAAEATYFLYFFNDPSSVHDAHTALQAFSDI